MKTNLTCMSVACQCCGRAAASGGCASLGRAGPRSSLSRTQRQWPARWSSEETRTEKYNAKIVNMWNKIHSGTTSMYTSEQIKSSISEMGKEEKNDLQKLKTSFFLSERGIFSLSKLDYFCACIFIFRTFFFSISVNIIRRFL